MKQVDKKSNRLDQWFAGLSKRERVIVLAALFLVPIYLFAQLVYLPERQQQKKIARTIVSKNQQNQALQVQLEELSRVVNTDPDKQQRQQIAKMSEQIAAFDQSIQTSLNSMVPPQRMASLLRSLLQKRPGLTLVSMKNLAAQPLNVATEDVSTSDTEKKTVKKEKVQSGVVAPEIALYRHSIELQFDGGYLAVVKYFTELQKLSQRLFWNGVEIEMGEHYPKAHVRVEIYTLSSERGWIGG